ncbi:MAG: nascent polypeptide-associated complex protein [Candidatus Micrarchaeaceae archaeon]
MLPNIDPKAIEAAMKKLGIKRKEIDALQVVIRGREKDIVIDNPVVSEMEMQGEKYYYIMGEAREEAKKAEINDEDIEFIASQTGIQDKEKIRKALEESNGDIAEAIKKLS